MNQIAASDILRNAYQKAWRWINENGETFYFPTKERAEHVQSKSGGEVLPPLNAAHIE